MVVQALTLLAVLFVQTLPKAGYHVSGLFVHLASIVPHYQLFLYLYLISLSN